MSKIKKKSSEDRLDWVERILAEMVEDRRRESEIRRQEAEERRKAAQQEAEERRQTAQQEAEERRKAAAKEEAAMAAWRAKVEKEAEERRAKVEKEAEERRAKVEKEAEERRRKADKKAEAQSAKWRAEAEARWAREEAQRVKWRKEAEAQAAKWRTEAEERRKEAEEERRKEDAQLAKWRAEAEARWAKMDKSIAEANERFGGYTQGAAESLEEEFADAVDENKHIGGIAVDEVYRNVHAKYEYDVVCVNGKVVVVVEVKQKLSHRDVRKFAEERLPHFAADCPLIAGRRKVFGAVGGGRITQKAKAEAAAHGLYVLRLRNRKLIIASDEGVRAV